MIITKKIAFLFLMSLLLFIHVYLYSQIISSAKPQSNNLIPKFDEIDPGKFGIIKCIFEFKAKDNYDKNIQTAEYNLILPANGKTYNFRLGPSIPIQTVQNFTVTTAYYDAATNINISANLLEKDSKALNINKALFKINIDYNRILDRSASMTALAIKLPYIDSNQCNTSISIKEGVVQELFSYQDMTSGRQFKINLRWIQLSKPKLYPRIQYFDDISCKLAFIDGPQGVHICFAFTADNNEYYFKYGVLIPVETIANQTLAAKYVLYPIGVNVRTYTTDSINRKYSFDLFITYSRLRERAIATKVETPYLDEISFHALTLQSEGAENEIYSANEGIRDRILIANFSWRRLPK